MLGHIFLIYIKTLRALSSFEGVSLWAHCLPLEGLKHPSRISAGEVLSHKQVVKPLYLKLPLLHIEDMDGYARELFFHRMSHFGPTASLLDEKM